MKRDWTGLGIIFTLGSFLHGSVLCMSMIIIAIVSLSLEGLNAGVPPYTAAQVSEA